MAAWRDRRDSGGHTRRRGGRDHGPSRGAAALRAFVDRVGRFLLFVNPASRRLGCGTALLNGVREAARAAGATRLLTGRSFTDTAEGDGTPAAVAFMSARGLAVAQEFVRYRTDVTRALDALGQVFRRYERIPAGQRRARIVSAGQVDPRRLAAFVVRELGGQPEEVAARLTGRGRAYCLATSMAALAGDTVVGAVLSIRRGSGEFIETRAVDAAHRGGWVNLALMHHNLIAAEPLGVRTIDFEHDAREPDTAKLARRFGATPVGTRQCWGCPLPAPAGMPEGTYTSPP